MQPQGNLGERIAHLISALGEGLYERQDVLRLCLLAALSGESVFLLGPPGIAKSLIARRLKQAFANARHFEYLMTRFSTPEEVFGPLSIQALKEEGKYHRLTAGYLPEAEVVFLDEIWKAGPAILNTLLTAINEHQFRNGDTLHTIPLRLLVTASNELPAPDSGLEALYDRMLIRLWLDRVQEKPNFRALLGSEGRAEVKMPAALPVCGEEYLAWQGGIEQVRLPDPVFELIYQLRHAIESRLANCYVSDRRWKKAVRLAKASAFFNGRDAVGPLDLLLLKDCLWHDESSRQGLHDIMSEMATLHCFEQLALSQRLQSLQEQLQQWEREVAERLAPTARRTRNWLGRETGWALHFGDHRGPKEKVALRLLWPAPLEADHPDQLSDELEFDRVVLDYWREGAESVAGRCLRHKWERQLELCLDEERHLQVLDSQRNPVALLQPTLMPEVVSAPWRERLAAITAGQRTLLQDIRRQRLIFEQQQSHLFLGEEWLDRIESSFYVLVRDAEAVMTRLETWKDRVTDLVG
ncbi:ATPase RavA domain-containing protein [Aeromonas diversa]|uniref:ATPase RavA domain-containing protein n=1 Tax=Aeromonas diversa TaxID=502790 RepID=UPI0039A02A85